MKQNASAPRRRARLAGAMVLLGTLAAACGGDPHGQPRLTGGTATLEELGDAVWTALVREDIAALDLLRLSELEHNELVWPEQTPAREASAAANLDHWWSNIQVRNRAAVMDLLRRHGGSDGTLEGVECVGETREYASFQALTDCRLLVRDAERREAVEAFRYVIRMDGRHKVVRYYEDQ